MRLSEGHLTIESIVVGPYENNVYVIACAKTSDAVLIDAPAEPDRIMAILEGLNVVEILITHGHADHIGAVVQLSKTLGIPWRMNPADIAIAGLDPGGALDETAPIRVGTLTVHPLRTPGHTPGSMSLRAGPVIFSGDTLFPGGPGATRWDYSSFPQIMESLESKLFTLGDDTIVYPGHGDPTTIGKERPFLPEWRARGW